MLVLTAGMCLIPVILYLVEYILIKKKYIIDEELYEQILVDLDERKKEN